MSDFKKIIKDQFINELNSPDDKVLIKEKLGINQNKEPKLATDKKKSFKEILFRRKKPIIIFSSVILIFVIAIVSMVAVTNYRNTPVYQGMEAKMLAGENKTKLRGVNRRIASFDDNINDLINDDIGVMLQEGIAYYAKKNETFEINVTIDNPKSFEILSFTLNGKLYQTFEFKPGSNSTQIIVDFKASDKSGIEVITIDAIKYVDNTTIKNARFGAERNIKIGVLYEELPKISSISETIMTTSFGVSFVLSDINNLVNLDNGYMIYLYDGSKIINITKLTLGMNVIPYSNLQMGKTYEYAIVAVYDPLDGMGKRAEILHKNNITTQEGIKVQDVVAGYDSLTINYETVDTENADISSIALYEGETLIDSIDNLEGDFTFSNLKSNTEYQFKTTYSYNIIVNNVEETIHKDIEYSFKTLTRPIPTIDIKDATATTDQVNFDFEIVDTTIVGKIINISLKLDDNVVATSDEYIKKFENLLSNKEYLLEVTYQYDLLDGTGFHTITNSSTITTFAKQVPTVNITDLVATQESISFNKAIVDIDNICEIVSYELWHNDQLVNTITDLDVLSFMELLSNNEYDLVINYQYDLNEGNDISKGSQRQTITTLEKAEPTMILTSGISFGNTITVWFEFIDKDEVCEFVSFELYKDGTLIETKTAPDNIFTNQEHNYIRTGDVSFNVTEAGTYKIFILYNYDLNDGEGVHVIDATNDIVDHDLVVVKQ